MEVLEENHGVEYGMTGLNDYELCWYNNEEMGLGKDLPMEELSTNFNIEERYASKVARRERKHREMYNGIRQVY